AAPRPCGASLQHGEADGPVAGPRARCGRSNRTDAPPRVVPGTQEVGRDQRAGDPQRSRREMTIPDRAFRADGSLNVVVETPRAAVAKFKYDADSGTMMLSRELPLGIAYPYDWGFVPATKAGDGDPLDAMVLWDAASYPGVVVPSRIIGALRVEQTNIRTRA